MRALFGMMLALSSVACTQEEAKQKYESTKGKAGELAAVAGEKLGEGAAAAKDAAMSAKDKAGEMAAAAGDKASALAEGAKDQAGAMATAAKDQISTLISGAKSTTDVITSVKTEFDKVYQSATTYDLEIASEGVDDAKMKALEAEIQALPNITVGDVKVAYQDRSATTINDVTYAKSFGAVWVVGGKKIALTFYTQQNIDTVAFVEALQKLVPVVEKYLK